MERQAQGRMTTRRRLALTVVSGCMVVGLAACSTSTTPATSRAPANGSTTSPVVAAVASAQFGTILESDGRPLYTLVPSSTPCDAACTKIWPEFLLPKGASKATAGSGVSASNLGTMDRGSVLQVTYAGQPLYFFSEDSDGQVKGNISDIWGKWSDVVIASPGNTPAPGGTPSSTSSTAGSNSTGAGSSSTGGGSTATTKAPTGTAPPASPTTQPPTPTTKPPTPTTQPPPPTTQPPPPTTTTTASGGGGGVGF